MEDKTYIVTLYKHEDLEQFYNEMESNNFHLVMKRPMSRNTHYTMTEEQAKILAADRSNNCLDTTKLSLLYPEIKNIKDSVRDTLIRMKSKLDDK